MQSRRSFLTQIAATAAVSSLPAPFVRAAAASNPHPIIGSGAHQFECVHDWLLPPEGMVWGDTHGLCQDSQGYIYVSHTVHASSMRPEAIAVFDPTGKFVRAFGEEYRGGAHGLDIRREGGTEVLYHCDTTRCKVTKTTLKGELLWSQGYPRKNPVYGEKPINFVPTNVAFAPNGEFYIGDGYGSHHLDSPQRVSSSAKSPAPAKATAS
ncbi:MAG TPA: hypothetical protein PKX00_09595 [Opitutaceae bacterium]|nr:hypothetical protein [Opitutaceae bacterium]